MAETIIGNDLITNFNKRSSVRNTGLIEPETGYRGPGGFVAPDLDHTTATQRLLINENSALTPAQLTSTQRVRAVRIATDNIRQGFPPDTILPQTGYKGPGGNVKAQPGYLTSVEKTSILAKLKRD